MQNKTLHFKVAHARYACLCFQNLLKTSKIGSKKIKTNKNIIKWSEDLKISLRPHKKAFFTFYNNGNQNFEKDSCQNMVAMETSSHVGCYIAR